MESGRFARSMIPRTRVCDRVPSWRRSLANGRVKHLVQQAGARAGGSQGRRKTAELTSARTLRSVHEAGRRRRGLVQQPGGAALGVEPLASADGLRVIVVDNNWSDESLDAVADLDIHRIPLMDNRGFSYGCNRGWRAGSGEFVLLLNPDARLTPDDLGRMLASFESTPGQVPWRPGFAARTARSTTRSGASPESDHDLPKLSFCSASLPVRHGPTRSYAIGGCTTGLDSRNGSPEHASSSGGRPSSGWTEWTKDSSSTARISISVAACGTPGTRCGTSQAPCAFTRGAGRPPGRGCCRFSRPADCAMRRSTSELSRAQPSGWASLLVA